jgi:hypothetical protein
LNPVKVTVKEQLAMFREHMRKKKRLTRERNEHFLKGNYELIYPLVSYFEEDRIRESISAQQEAA